MGYGIGVMLRASFGFAVLIGWLAGCSALMDKQQEFRAQVERNHDSHASRRVRLWLGLRQRLQGQRSLSELGKVALVNDFFNALPWRSDWDNWQREDYWATPLETILNNGGDCEDLAIAKYFTLLESGIDADRLRLTYAWLVDPRRAHVVLVYFPEDGGEALILDNLNQAALGSSQRSDLDLVYSFNDDKLWVVANGPDPAKIASQDRLPQWRRVNERMEAEAMQQSWSL